VRAVLLAILLTTSSPIWATIGTVADSKGSACEIQRNKTKLPGSKGAAIESMDTYVTGACSASITFKDDTKVKVTENSRLLIDDFVFDPKKSDAGKLSIKAAMGTVRYTSGQIAKNNPQAVDVKTPTASIAVRGTDFTMTVDETGESLVVLVPSCKDERDQKKYELDEQRCRVGKISVTTLAGSVELDRAFEATYVTSPSVAPTPPTVINTIEGKIGNNLILVKPNEIQRAIAAAGKNKRDLELEELEAEAQRQMMQRLATTNAEQSTTKLPFTFADGKKGCDPSKNICVRWDNPDAADMPAKGRGTAFRRTGEDHYAEVKTTGYSSNTNLTIIQNDTVATEILGDGSPGGNTVTIKQNLGVLKR
jgi:hypothetical protein